MFQHVKHEVCTTKFENRMLTCTYTGCTHQCANASAIRSHSLAHYGIKEHFCDVEKCGRAFVHASSLTNHHHDDHSDIFGPRPNKSCKKDETSRSSRKHKKDETSRSSSKHRKKDKQEKKDNPFQFTRRMQLLNTFPEKEVFRNM